MPRVLVVVPDGMEPRIGPSAEVGVAFESALVKCHCVADVADVAEARAAWVTLSPVARTLSKPGYGPPLGVTGVREAAALAGDVKVFALGGVTAANARSFVEAGAYGVAVMGAVLRSDDPDTVVAEIVAALR